MLHNRGNKLTQNEAISQMVAAAMVKNSNKVAEEKTLCASNDSYYQELCMSISVDAMRVSMAALGLTSDKRVGALRASMERLSNTINRTRKIAGT